MRYTPEEVMQYIREADVKFVRMAFCDVYGRQKNMAIMAEELPRAFAHGVVIDGSAIDGFGRTVRSDLVLHPDAATLIQLPWRPQRGKVAQMFCGITLPDGTPFAGDTRRVLQTAVQRAEAMGYTFSIGSELEFYLFRLDENGEPTRIPHDRAGYMDIAPADRGENVRREICLTLEQMGITPESSHHESGPGQNEIDFRYADPLTAADNAVTFRTVVRTIAAQNGLWADFSPKPLPDADGSGMHINISASGRGKPDPTPKVIAGILRRAREMTLFLNPLPASYERLGKQKAPNVVAWAPENRTQLIRIPAASGEFRRAELRSPDPMTNPYLAFALVIQAALDGIEQNLPLREYLDVDMFTEANTLQSIERLPASLAEASAIAAESGFIRSHLTETILSAYCSER